MTFTTRQLAQTHHMTLNDLLGALNSHFFSLVPTWISQWIIAAMRLKVCYVLRWRTPQTAAVGGSKGGERPDGRRQCWCFTADWKYIATYHAGGWGGGGGSSLFICELFLGHIGYISLKTKNILHFFIIIFLAKTYKKKKSQKKCLSGALGGRDVCAVTAVFSPCTASFLRGCCKSSRFLSLDLQPEGGTSPDFGGYRAGTQRISRNRGLGTSILVPSLRKKKKKKKLLGLALFQSRFRLASFNKTITIACVVVFSFCLGFIVRRGQKLLFTPHWT